MVKNAVLNTLRDVSQIIAGIADMKADDSVTLGEAYTIVNESRKIFNKCHDIQKVLREGY